MKPEQIASVLGLVLLILGMIGARVPKPGFNIDALPPKWDEDEEWGRR